MKVTGTAAKSSSLLGERDAPAPQIYYHGEPISVNVHVTNNTNKTVKKMKVSGGSPVSVRSTGALVPERLRCFLSATAGRHLPVQHSSVQVRRGHGGDRVSSSGSCG